MRILGGKFKGQKITAPPGLDTRPTSSRMREALFNICQNQIIDASFLDLFAGSGAMGIEAMSRGAKSAIFVENDRNASKAIKSNLSKLEIEKETRLLPLDVFAALKKFHSQGKNFDLIWADPPYQKDLSLQLLQELDTMSLLSAGGTLFIEERIGALDDIEASLEHLKLTDVRTYGKSALYTFQKEIHPN